MSAEMNKTTKVGIISCSGEEIAEGTISRNAVRRVLESLRPHDAVTLCLPLFLAGNEGERNFARTHPTITIDGCDKQCARWGTEKHGGPVARSLVVSDILGDQAASCSRSLRDRTPADAQAVATVADRIAAEIDGLLSEGAQPEMAEDPSADVCACMKPISTGFVTVNGQQMEVPALPLVFAECAKQGLRADDAAAAGLLEKAKVFHYIAPDAEDEYTKALLEAYRAYLGG
jgi:uncharacterized metal-binding protein